MDPTNDIIKHLLKENNDLREAKEKLYTKNRNLRQEVRNLNRANIGKILEIRQLQDSNSYWREQAGYTNGPSDSIEIIEPTFDERRSILMGDSLGR
jgi:hypothetical protein